MAAKKSPKPLFQNHDEACGIQTDENGNRIIHIREFDMNQMHPLNENDTDHASRSIVIGHPGYGKSKIIQQIMLYKSHICPVSQIFSGTETVNHFYRDQTTNVTIFNELDLKAMENFAKRQNIARQFLPNPWAIQILDDVTDEPAVLKKKPFGAYFKKGRHWTMVHVEAVQYPMDIPAGLRSCVDYVFIMANGIISEREKLYENFASGCIPSYNDFCDIMDQLTEDFTALIIDNTSQSPLVSDRVFFFKADLSRVPVNFKVGCTDAHNFNEKRMDPNYRDSYL
jgi:hypothetical protein